MSDPAHYVTSDYYQPGIMNEVGAMGAGVLVILALFVLSVFIAPRLLRRRRRMNPVLRKVFEWFELFSKPRSPIAFGWRRQEKLGRRKKSEPHYKLKLDTSSVTAEPKTAAPSSKSIAMEPASTFQLTRKRIRKDTSALPEEAWPTYGEDEIEAVISVLRSGKVNQWTGDKVFEFERAYTRELRNGRTIALANGSLALELALRAFGVGPGDEVVVTPRSFVASAFCVRLVGAVPVFADVDRDSGNVTASTIEAVLTPRTKAIIPVHLGGWPADITAIAALAKSRSIYLIEDCAQAHGAEVDGLPVGSFGDAAAFSFCQDKIISTAGEGGLVTFRDPAAYDWAWSFKDHGKNRERALSRASSPGFRWLHDQVGTNWRMTEVAAAVGLLQLEKLPRWRSARSQNAQIWRDALSAIPGIRMPMPPRNVTGAFYKAYAYVDVQPEANEQLRDRILQAAGAKELRVFSGSCSEMYREAAFRDMAVEPLPIARELGQTSLMFEVHPTLDKTRLRDRADAVAHLIGQMLN